MATATKKDHILINPPGTEELYNTWQYSQAVRVGDIVWLAGQIGIDQNGQTGGTVEAQTGRPSKICKRFWQRPAARWPM